MNVVLSSLGPLVIDINAVLSWIGAIISIVTAGKLIVQPILQLITRRKEAAVQREAAITATIDDIREGVQVLLNFRLTRECERALGQSMMTIDEQRRITDLYQAYHTLGGNGSGTALYNRTMALPIDTTD